MAVATQRGQRHRFELGQHRVVEKPEHRHHAEQRECRTGQGKTGEAQQSQRAGRNEPQPGTRAAGGVRGPHRRCDDARGVPQTKHRADHESAMPHRVDPAPDIRRVGTQRGVVAEVEEGETESILEAGVARWHALIMPFQGIVILSAVQNLFCMGRAEP